MKSEDYKECVKILKLILEKPLEKYEIDLINTLIDRYTKKTTKLEKLH